MALSPIPKDPREKLLKPRWLYISFIFLHYQSQFNFWQLWLAKKVENTDSKKHPPPNDNKLPLRSIN